MKRPLRDLVLEVLGSIAPEADLSRLDPREDLRDALEIDSMDLLWVSRCMLCITCCKLHAV